MREEKVMSWVCIPPGRVRLKGNTARLMQMLGALKPVLLRQRFLSLPIGGTMQHFARRKNDSVTPRSDLRLRSRAEKFQEGLPADLFSFSRASLWDRRSVSESDRHRGRWLLPLPLHKFAPDGRACDGDTIP